MSTLVNLEIFNPYQGFSDLYSVELSQDCMTISMSGITAKATWIEDCVPEWSGVNIYQTMNHDGIYPPNKIQDLFERAWKAWRNGDLTEHQVDVELNLLANWVNEVTRSRPKSDFWG